jgi:hypothetical protein
MNNKQIFYNFHQNDQHVKQWEPRIFPGKAEFEIPAADQHQGYRNHLYNELYIQEKNQEYQQLNIDVAKNLYYACFFHESYYSGKTGILLLFGFFNRK